MSLELARKVLRIEGEAVLALIERVDERFREAVEILYRGRGKIVLTGMGKSGLIGRKLAATFASTGTPAYFLHPAEGVHGDLGILEPGDVLIALSYSGETEEVIRLLPAIKRLGLAIIALTGAPSSTLARAADVLLDVSVKEEACPLGLTPTSSTTAALAMGDALALALLDRRGFTENEFARLHPSGTLGRRLLLRVEDLMHRGSAIPLVRVDTPMRQAVVEMTSKRLGVTGVLDEAGRLVGVVTDGDLRRGLEQVEDLLAVRAGEAMTGHPKWIDRHALAVEALRRMEEHAITSLFVFADSRREELVGIIHIHDVLRAGIA
ncbi:MAG: KpsF/GutQ family sugar-phosphate isomerase [Deltaproteobacteria bacterium]|nr:KpsF/GutQ family sugar-phosphate isomerase [Deltaproteobacteria bacterium]